VALAAIPVTGQQQTVVRVGTLKLVGGAPLFVAQDRGYFRREGVDIRFVYFGAVAPVATAVVTEDVEVGRRAPPVPYSTFPAAAPKSGSSQTGVRSGLGIR
jgi:ABC-type nitrate/sulfonate/bicarbonate transport system substrate-binding protein